MERLTSAATARFKRQYNPDGQLRWTEDQDGYPTDYGYDPVDDSLSTMTGPADPGNDDMRPVTNDYDEETAIGWVSGTTYTPGPALNGLQAYFGKTTEPRRAAAAAAPTSPRPTRQRQPHLRLGRLRPKPALHPRHNTDYTVRFAGDITLGDNGDPDREYPFQTDSRQRRPSSLTAKS